MELKDFITVTLSIITGLGSWVGSYLMATNKSKQELKTLAENNRHDIDMLMK
jgi:hypothetical protein